MADASTLLAEYRRRADDDAAPPHVSDAQVFAMLSEAEREACMRDHAIFDTETAEIVSYAVAADAASVTLDPRVLRIDHATFTPTTSTRACTITLTGIDAIRERQNGNTYTASYPSLAAHSARTTLTLFPAPTAAGTLALDVYRLPLYDIEGEADEPEIGTELHDGLVDWVLYRVYSTKDSELEDPARAQTALRDFTDRFGERRSADAQRRHRERRRITTRPVYP